MGTYTWNGGTGAWTNPANWAPAGYPQTASDTAIFASGTATLQGISVDIGNLEIGSGNPSAPAQLVLSSTVLGPDFNASVSPVNATMPSGGWAVVTIDGSATDEGNFSVVTASNPNNTLDFRIAPGGVFVQDGGITVSASQFGDAQLYIRGTGTGGSSTTLENNGIITIANGGAAGISSNVTGSGTIGIETNSATPGVLPTSVEFGGYVDAAQTVDLGSGQLLLDQPMQFLGTIAGWTDVGLVELENTAATSAVFTQTSTSGGSLHLYDAGHDMVADLHLTGSYDSSDFRLQTFGNATFLSVVGSGNGELGGVAHSCRLTDLGRVSKDLHQFRSSVATLIADSHGWK